MSIVFHMMQQRTEPWYEIKRGKVSGSRVSDAFNIDGSEVSSYQIKKIAYLLYAEMNSSFSSELDVTQAGMNRIQRGIDHEDTARKWYEQATGQSVMEVGFVENSMYTGAGCSPDGVITKEGDEHPRGGVEFKCPDTTTHLATLDKGSPYPGYKIQCVWNMMICDVPWWDFVTFDDRLHNEELHGRIIRYTKAENLALMNKLNKARKRIETSLKNLDKKMQGLLDES